MSRAARLRKRLRHSCYWTDIGKNHFRFREHECVKCGRRQIYAHGKWLDVERERETA